MSDVEGLETLNDANSLASTWVAEMLGINVEEENNREEPKMELRPSRLGVGAKFVPHSQSLEKNAGTALETKLKKGKRGQIFEDAQVAASNLAEVENENIMESRAGSFFKGGKPPVHPLEKLLAAGTKIGGSVRKRDIELQATKQGSETSGSGSLSSKKKKKKTKESGGPESKKKRED